MANAAPSIAVVDDDQPVLKALERLLRGRGFDVNTYGSAYALIDALPDRLPGCLILDLQMPDMNGLELLRYLKRCSIRVPTIIITAYGDEGMRDRCMAAGAVAFLAKPLQSDALIDAIHAACGGDGMST